jgi:hypothetical protein
VCDLAVMALVSCDVVLESREGVRRLDGRRARGCLVGGNERAVFAVQMTDTEVVHAPQRDALEPTLAKTSAIASRITPTRAWTRLSHLQRVT